MVIERQISNNDSNQMGRSNGYGRSNSSQCHVYSFIWKSVSNSCVARMHKFSVYLSTVCELFPATRLVFALHSPNVRPHYIWTLQYWIRNTAHLFHYVAPYFTVARKFREDRNVVRTWKSLFFCARPFVKHFAVVSYLFCFALRTWLK